MSKELLDNLKKAVITYDTYLSKSMAKDAIEKCLEPAVIIDAQCGDLRS